MIKTIIVPIVALLALVAKYTLGIEIAQEVLNGLVDASVELVMVIVTIYGVIKNNDKKDKQA